jgi:hypothetical protein
MIELIYLKMAMQQAGESQMFRSIILVSTCLTGFGAVADEVPQKPNDALKAPMDGVAKPLTITPAGVETSIGNTKLPLARARIFGFYAQNDEAPEIASLRADGSKKQRMSLPRNCEVNIPISANSLQRPISNRLIRS